MIEVLGHTTVYEAGGIYASHPANHGAWVNADGEMLVGFLTGAYDKRLSPHPVREPYMKLLAHSADGGLLWSIESPNVDFKGTFVVDRYWSQTDGMIFRVCGIYDTGGEYCRESGAFYASPNFGRTWNGPFAFVGLEDVFSDGWENTSRTRIDYPFFYLTRREAGRFGTDECFRAELKHDGTFELVDWICRGNVRAVMPAVAYPYAALRMRDSPSRVELFRHDEQWRRLGVVSETGRHNGNPPALALMSSKLVCAYGDRSSKAIFIAVRHDVAWNATAIRSGRNSDIGYPQLLALPDGTACCVYYWSDEKRGCTSIECTRFRLAA